MKRAEKPNQPIQNAPGWMAERAAPKIRETGRIKSKSLRWRILGCITGIFYPT
jgi:hypothetical protein